MNYYRFKLHEDGETAFDSTHDTSLNMSEMIECINAFNDLLNDINKETQSSCSEDIYMVTDLIEKAPYGLLDRI